MGSNGGHLGQARGHYASLIGFYDSEEFSEGYIGLKETHLGSVVLRKDQWRSIRGHWVLLGLSGVSLKFIGGTWFSLVSHWGSMDGHWGLSGGSLRVSGAYWDLVRVIEPTWGVIGAQ